MSYHDSLECNAAQEKAWGRDAPSFDEADYLDRLVETDEFDLLWKHLLEQGEIKELARRALSLGQPKPGDALLIANALAGLVTAAAGEMTAAAARRAGRQS